MVRIALVAGVSLAVSALNAQSAISTIPDGSRLALSQYCYTMTATKDGVAKPVGATYQSISRQHIRGIDALAIVVHQHMYSGKFDMRDSFLLRRDDLRPIQVDTDRNGEPHVHLDYSDKRISGWKVVGKTKQPVSVELSGPVWDGNLWGLTFAALPLTSGAVLTLPTYQYDSGLGRFYVDALNENQESTPSGVVQAWHIKAGLSRAEQVEYTVSTLPGLEIAYSTGPSSQPMGGDCSGVKSFGESGESERQTSTIAT